MDEKIFALYKSLYDKDSITVTELLPECVALNKIMNESDYEEILQFYRDTCAYYRMNIDMERHKETKDLLEFLISDYQRQIDPNDSYYDPINKWSLPCNIMEYKNNNYYKEYIESKESSGTLLGDINDAESL